MAVHQAVLDFENRIAWFRYRCNCNHPDAKGRPLKQVVSRCRLQCIYHYCCCQRRSDRDHFPGIFLSAKYMLRCIVFVGLSCSARC